MGGGLEEADRAGKRGLSMEGIIMTAIICVTIIIVCAMGMGAGKK